MQMAVYTFYHFQYRAIILSNKKNSDVILKIQSISILGAL